MKTQGCARGDARGPRALLIASLVGALIGSSLVGCGPMRERQLTRVAKDWCQTIRASQVIPIYPLTEDVVPGDVFLVTTPIPDQARVYREQGFLPLDMHKVRLAVTEYPEFYHQSRGIGTRLDTPYHWIYPDPAGENNPCGDHAGSRIPTEPPEVEDVGEERRHTTPTAFWQAPHAFFPTYSFKVSTSTGINAAIPIQSVPVSLAFMNTTSATGSAQLADAYAYGVSEQELDHELHKWAREHRASLIRLKQANPHTPIFLRVVNRVYLIGAINVSLTNTNSGRFDGKGGADVGTPETRPPAEGGDGPADETERDAPAPAAPATVPAANAAGLAALGKAASAGTPGVAVSFAYATSRQVVANEVFRRPLVVGFIALDYPILPDGDLGEAVATSRTLMGVDESIPESAAAGDEIDQGLRLYKSAIAARKPEQQSVLWRKAAGFMPSAFKKVYEAKPAESPNETPAESFERAETEYTNVRNNAPRRRVVLEAIRKSWNEVFNAPE